MTGKRLLQFLARLLFWGGSLVAVGLFNYFALETSRIIWVATFFSVLLFAVLVLLYRKVLRRIPAVAGALGSLMIVATVSIIWASPTLAQPEGFTSSGGVTWSNETGGYGTSNAQVWHVGHYPLGGFKNYEAGIRVRYSTGHESYNRMDSSGYSVTPYVEDERFVDYQDNYVIQQKSYLYSCVVSGILRWHGCLYAYAKFRIPVTMPIKGQVKVVYPWVAIWINANDGVFKWDWSGGMM